jgi:hypothetical protein
MGKVLLKLRMSLDSYVARPDISPDAPEDHGRASR